MARKTITATRVEPEVSPAEDLFGEPVVEETPKKATPKKKAAKKSFEQTDKILCHSVTQGGLYVDGMRTKTPYTFANYSVEEEIEYRDLVAMIQAHSDFIFHPYFIIDDADFVAEFPELDKFYSSSYEMSDLAGILELPVDKMMETIKKLPAGAADNLKTLASSQVVDGKLDSVKKIRELNDFFGIDLNFIADLNED